MFSQHRISRIEDPGSGVLCVKLQAELDSGLGAQAKKAKVEHVDDLVGNAVEVRYKDGELVVACGPRATADHIRWHVPTVKTMLRYRGVVGAIRKLKLRIEAFVKRNKALIYGREGFEAVREIEKIQGIIQEIEGRIAQRGRLMSFTNQGRGKAGRKNTDAAAKEVGEMHADLAAYKKQLAHWEKRVNSDVKGRGAIASGNTKTKLDPASEQKWDALRKKDPAKLSESEAVELEGLRVRRTDQPEPLERGSTEHKAAAWAKTDAAGKKDGYAKWSKRYANDEQELVDLRAKDPAELTRSEAERLVALRRDPTRVEGPQAEPGKWTAEHKAERWEDYKANPDKTKHKDDSGKADYAKWSAGYEVNRRKDGRGEADEIAALKAIDVARNTGKGQQRTTETIAVTDKSGNHGTANVDTVPDMITSKVLGDVKSVTPAGKGEKPNKLSMTAQLRAQRSAAKRGWPPDASDKLTPRKFVVIMVSPRSGGVRPNSVLGDPKKNGADAVLHRNSKNAAWHKWNTASSRWDKISKADAEDIVKNGGSI